MLQDFAKALDRFRQAAKAHQDNEQQTIRQVELQAHAEPSMTPRVQELHRTMLPVIRQGKG